MSALIERVVSGVASRVGFQSRRPWPGAAEALYSLTRYRDLLGEVEPDAAAFLHFCGANAHRSTGQLFQDLFALHELGEKRGGFFVEFGATDGVTLSNTHLLEKEYGWTGILAEPAHCWADAIQANRTSTIDLRCVTDRTGDTVQFMEAESRELSTMTAYSDGDSHASARRGSKHYTVPTVSLNDLLDEHGAPELFDFLSIDTEGSELTILTALNFEAHRPRVITVEHNFSATREGLYALLTGKGYVRKFEQISMFDDWYVLQA